MAGKLAALVKTGAKKATKTMPKEGREAVSRLKNLKNRMAKYEEKVSDAVGTAVCVVETQATTFVGSVAEGRWGKDKMRKLGADVRWWGGGILLVGGFADLVFGKGKLGHHAVALGNGFVASKVASLGVEVGQAMATKAGEAPASSPVPSPTPAVNGDDARPSVAGRDVELLPGPGIQGDDLGARNRRAEAERARRIRQQEIAKQERRQIQALRAKLAKLREESDDDDGGALEDAA